MMHRHMKETVPTGGPSYHLDQHFSGILRAPSFTKIVDADAFHAFSCLEPQREAQTIYRRHSDFGRFESGVSLRQKDHGWNIGPHSCEQGESGCHGSRLILLSNGPPVPFNLRRPYGCGPPISPADDERIQRHGLPALDNSLLCDASSHSSDSPISSSIS